MSYVVKIVRPVLEYNDEAKCHEQEQAEPENAPQKRHVKRVVARNLGSTAVTLDAVASCEAQGYMDRSHQTGRYRSGQTGQTVNLLALRLRWFESSPAQFPNGPVACAVRSARRSID